MLYNILLLSLQPNSKGLGFLSPILKQLFN
jgi:hypothetical protein